MRAALSLAARGLGTTWPNPSVGCVLVRDGTVLARGWTRPGGRPHAEADALSRAGDAARGATAYVTLEPCSHHGKTPPCADALVSAGVARVVVACGDPDPRVNGRGIERLRAAGIEVATGVLERDALDLNAGFFLRVREGRPLVTLKLATTLDGRIATRSGESQWITGPQARAAGHLLRSRNDAIMVGIGTAMADDPELTCRLPGLEHRSPVRVVVDSRLRLELTAKLVRTAGQVPTWIACLEGSDRAQAFRDARVELLEIVPGADGEMPVRAVLKALGAKGITRVLAEGGARLAASLMRECLADRIEWFRAASIIGGDGLPALQGFGLERLAEAPAFERTSVRQCGADVVESYRRAV